MSDEKTYTERDIVLAKREGWVRHCVATCGGKEEAEKYAAREYPLPRVTRPRVVRRVLDQFEYEFRLVNDTLEFNTPGLPCWEEYCRSAHDPGEWPALLSILDDLRANPTEEVEE